MGLANIYTVTSGVDEVGKLVLYPTEWKLLKLICCM